MKALFAALFLIPTGFLLLGIWAVRDQHRRVTSFRPVPARVIAAEIGQRTTRSEGRSHTTYRPVIRYQYEVDDRLYESTQLNPVGTEWSSHAWAAEILAAYPVGRELTAYVDPAEPAEAFLIREHDFFPYVFVIVAFPVAGFLLVLGNLFGAFRPTGAEPRAHPMGGFVLAPGGTNAGWVRLLGTVAGLWYVGGAVVVGHFASVAESPFVLFPLLFMSIYVLVGFVPIGFALYFRRAGAFLDEARVRIGVSRPTAGASLDVWVEQRARVPLAVRVMTVALACAETTPDRVVRIAHEDRAPVLENVDVAVGGNLAGTRRITVPAEPAGPTPGRLSWWIEVATEGAVRGMTAGMTPVAGPEVKYLRKFPIRIGLP